MKYVVVSLVKGKAGEFNNKLRKELFDKFKSRASKLPAHFTIKAPFEYDGSILDLEEAIEKAIIGERATNYKVEGYDFFDDRVVFMKMNMSNKGKIFHNKLVEHMSKVPYVKFSKIDGKDKVFHITLASKKIRSIHYEIWNHVNNYECDFKCKFDNVCIYRWIENTWELYREFKILN